MLLTLPVVSVYVLPVDISSLCRVTDSAQSAVDLVRSSGTLTVALCLCVLACDNDSYYKTMAVVTCNIKYFKTFAKMF